MQKSRLILVAFSAMFCAASATQAANWVPLDTVAEDAPLVRTNHDDSEDGSNSAVICSTPPWKEGGPGIKGGGRRIGYIGEDGKCKTVGKGAEVRKIEEDIMVLLDDHHVPGSTYEPATMEGDHDEIGPGGPAPVDLALLASCLEEDGATAPMLERVTNCATTMFPGHDPNEDVPGP